MLDSIRIGKASSGVLAGQPGIVAVSACIASLPPVIGQGCRPFRIVGVCLVNRLGHLAMEGHSLRTVQRSQQAVAQLVVGKTPLPVSHFQDGGVDAHRQPGVHLDASATRCRAEGSQSGQDIQIEGVILRDSSTWTIPIRQSDRVAVKNVKLLGYRATPGYLEPRTDIIETIELGGKETLCAFCRGIQSGSPIDAFVTPEPWEMPGYDDPVIMAAGAFVQGASIELSCDAPMRAPFAVYQQGALTYASGRRAVAAAFERLLEVSDA